MRSLYLSLVLAHTVHSLSHVASYSNLWVDPSYILARNFPPETGAAQNTILEWATILASDGPWTVLNKTVLAPSGDPHDYMSWAPYSWPNCSSIPNADQLTPPEIWRTCPYHNIDGEFNPDGRLVDNIGAFSDLADAVIYNSIAWVLTNFTDVYAENAVNFIQTWFLDPETRMNPELIYAQMNRGPDGQVGAHTGILDLKCMAKIVNGILILRQANSTAWTKELDTRMVNWTNTYIQWIETWPTAIEESRSPNNHGSFYFSQLSALKILVGDLAGAREVVEAYFSTTWQHQIWSSGEQPFEAVRTRPYHYRAYNLNAMITVARIGEYLGFDAWNLTTLNGSTIQNACDWAMLIPSYNEAAGELYPNVADIGAKYGDPDGKYAAFLYSRQHTYAHNPYFLWDQPFSDSGLMMSRNVTGNVTSPEIPTDASSDGAMTASRGVWTVIWLSVLSVWLLSL